MRRTIAELVAALKAEGRIVQGEKPPFRRRKIYITKRAWMKKRSVQYMASILGSAGTFYPQAA